MNRSFQIVCLIILSLIPPAASQTIDDLSKLWQDTYAALKNSDQSTADTLFKRFNQSVRLYGQENGRPGWKVELLAGSLNCLFPQSRTQGAQILEHVRETARDLNEKGMAEVNRLLQNCTAQQVAPVSEPLDPLGNLVATSATYQAPRLRADTKAGYLNDRDHVSGVAVSPVEAAELLSRRVPVSEPQKALQALRAREPRANAVIVGDFVVTGASTGDARRIGNCLETYLSPLKQEFEIDAPRYMVTVYTADSPHRVSESAAKRHGLDLPGGVAAYSVREDMSMSGMAYPSSCGSLAHELVHLLIKDRFPMGPAWLEEGLASEVAVAAPHAKRFRLSWSWRDDMLQHTFELRPTVETLLKTPWGDFSATSSDDLRRAAALQAMAAIFIRYLDAKGKLKEVYFAARDQHISADLSQYRSYKQILEQILGESVDRVDRDFVAWFKHEQEMLPKDDTPKGPPCKGPTQGPCQTMKTAS